ncbi:substrate-binding domain-containing protein, partial [Streptomyces phytophilus]|uniref:substrate-binding domain-containing protein n=1 Tax=Streptomyces phytophilus TaxID=722715 RepID=UPI0015F106CF
TGTERLRGYADALAAAGLPADDTYIRQGQQQTAEATRAAAALLALPAPPTALFCSNNRNTIGAFRAIREAGTATALAGFDDFEMADTLGLPLTLVAYDTDELGREAGRLLLARLGERTGTGAGAGPGPGTGTVPAPPERRTVVPTTLVAYGTPDP